MKLAVIKNVITSKAGLKLLQMQKQSPTLLFAVGVVGVVGAVVLASRATLKLEDVLKKTEEDLSKIEEASSIEEYTEDDAKKDRVLVYVKTVGRITALYAIPTALLVVSIGALTGSHIILNKRNSSLTAAYVTLDRAFKEYRKRVVADQGADKDLEYRYDMVDKEVAVDTPEGVVIKTIKVPNTKNLSGYARVWDENTSRHWNKTWHYNQMLIECKRAYANQLLQARGYLFLNEVHEMLGLDWTEEGQIVGWIKGQGDDYVDFGIFDNDNMSFVNGDERSVVLDFNVQGPIHKFLGSSIKSSKNV